MAHNGAGFETIRVERRNGIVTVTLARPERRNAVNPTMWEELRACFVAVSHSPDDRCLVLTGDGEHFCSGADLVAGRSVDSPLGWMHLVNSAVLALYRLPQPAIAKVRGVAVGAGMSLALACDLVVVDETARFAAPFVSRALSPDTGASWLLPRLVGPRKAAELVLLGSWVEAGEAAALGMVNRVLPDAELDGFVAEWADRIAAGPADATRLTKGLLAHGLDVTLEQALDDEGQAQALNLYSPDLREALIAFRERRPPVFGRGRGG